MQQHPVAGRTLLHYQIMKQVGSGGMGEVYQAKDLSLGRDVGIKVIPQEFARDPDRIARFKREAKLLALSQSSQYCGHTWAGRIGWNTIPRP